MRVFRVENLSGIGPFSDGITYGQMTNILGFEYHAKMPLPECDGIRAQNRDHKWFCGTKTLEKIWKWFPPAVHSLLLTNGFDVVEFEVDEAHVIEGKHQVIFRKEGASVHAIHHYPR